jgi:hypothetical protein
MILVVIWYQEVLGATENQTNVVVHAFYQRILLGREKSSWSSSFGEHAGRHNRIVNLKILLAPAVKVAPGVTRHRVLFFVCPKEIDVNC